LDAAVKERVRGFASRSLVAGGLTALGRRFGDRDGTIVVYGHRVRDDDEGFLQGLAPAWFRDQIAYLTRHYEVIPLRTLVDCLEAGRAPPARSVVVTLDDGFRDNVEAALPILDDFGVKATIFVVTQSLTDGRLPWSQRLGFAFQHTSITSLRHAWLSPDETLLPDEPSRRRAYLHVKRRLVAEPRESRDAHIEAWARTLAVDLPDDRMMTWDHARTALDHGHEIGAHTYSHALLAAVTADEARTEMLRSRTDLAERLGLEHPPFCFPGGSTTAELREVARALGFRATFLPDPRRRLNRPPDVDAFSMVRVGLPNAPAYHLEAELDGPFHAVRGWAGRYGRLAKG
jgi:peptidoglycan/xylan/chitin deacetylase (PgdA/CDA1 family)